MIVQANSITLGNLQLFANYPPKCGYKFCYLIDSRELERMKIFGFLCIQAITAQDEVDECLKEENKDLSSNYCRTRGKTLDNDKV